MKSAICFGLFMVLIAATAALGGEAEVVKIQPANRMVAVPPPGSNTELVARAALVAEMVAVIKVTEITEPDEKEGDKKEEEKKEEAAANQPQQIVFMGMGGQPTRKNITAQVVEVLKGDKETKQVLIVANVYKSGRNEQIMVEQKTGNFVRRYGIPFNLPKDKDTLVFLAAAKGTGEGEKKEWQLLQPVLVGAPKESVTAATEAIRTAAEWDKEPELSAEDAAAIDKLIADLGDKAFTTRESATEALIAKGGAVRGRIRTAQKSQDPEVRERAGHILDAITPAFLKSSPAGDPSSSTIMHGANGVMIMQQIQQNGGQVKIEMRAGGAAEAAE